MNVHEVSLVCVYDHKEPFSGCADLSVLNRKLFAFYLFIYDKLLCRNFVIVPSLRRNYCINVQFYCFNVKIVVKSYSCAIYSFFGQGGVHICSQTLRGDVSGEV